MIRIPKGQRSWADIGWLAAAAALFIVLVGMMFMMFAWADDAGATVGIDKFLFGPTALTVTPGTTVDDRLRSQAFQRDGLAPSR